jgi:hypothetical protein
VADLPETPEPAEALHQALRRVLEPLAKLAVGQGIGYATLDAWLRAALVKEAFEAHPSLPAHRRASRISATTGLHRREVTRLLEEREASAAPKGSLAAEVFAHWRSDPAYQDMQGNPRVVPRLGPAPSFEALAHAITRDVHPRTLLAELLRLELARTREDDDTVALVSEGFVPRGDASRMAGFLGDNVGDHLSAAVDNVLQGGGRHLEQAVYADGLSHESLMEFKQLAMKQWQQVAQALVPELERLLARDEARGGGTHRVRLGLYGYDEPQKSQEKTEDKQS